jgi:hypothetical protein
LAEDPRFASGILGGLHSKDVGFPTGDFRSWASTLAPFSLQVSIGPKGGFADIDRYNPYSAAGFVSHAALEVLVPSALKKPWPW